jgi:hypothetical protein
MEDKESIRAHLCSFVANLLRSEREIRNPDLIVALDPETKLAGREISPRLGE